MTPLFTKRPRLFATLLLVNMTAALLAVWTLNVNSLGIDDAYIYFVYAKNFLASGEFVYNLGGERVEGFSSPLWMLICIVAMWISAEPQIPLFLIASLLATTISFYAVCYTESLLTEQNRPDGTGPLHIGSWIFLAMLIGNPSWLVWNISSLMETPLWGALIFGMMMRLISMLRAGIRPSSDKWLTPALLALLVFCRPEAPLWVGWFLLAYALVLRALGLDARSLFTALVAPILTTLFAAGLLFGVRLSYFGYLFANTYYAKMSPDFAYNLAQGGLYLLEFCVENGIAVLGILAAIWLGIRSLHILWPAKHQDDQARLRRDTESMLLAGTVAAGVFAALITGGDKFGGFRFYQSFLPVLYLLIIYAAVLLLPRAKDWLARTTDNLTSLAISTLALLLLTNILTSSWSNLHRTNLAIEFDIARHMRNSAALLDEIFLSTNSELPRVALIPAGGFKFESQAEAFDLMGLNFTRMAHSDVRRDGIKNHAAFDPDIFWDLDIGILGARRCKFENLPWQSERFEWRVLKGLPGNERFMQNYSYSHFRVSSNDNWICGYVSNSLFGQVAGHPDMEIHTFEDHEIASHSTCESQEDCD